MASYTTNYQLHQWEASDDFLRTDFNTDFQKIDAALGAKAEAEETQAELEKKAEVVKGTYTGNGGTLAVNLGFRPRAVLVSLGSWYYNEPRFSIDGEGSYLDMTANGFEVQQEQNSRMNVNNRVYQYLALR